MAGQRISDVHDMLSYDPSTTDVAEFNKTTLSRLNNSGSILISSKIVGLVSVFGVFGRLFVLLLFVSASFVALVGVAGLEPFGKSSSLPES